MSTINTQSTTSPISNTSSGDQSIIDSAGEVFIESPRGLSARNVSCWFGEKKVLEGVNLVMRPLEVTALIGPSGCGKSTFLRTLNRMHELGLKGKLGGDDLSGGTFTLSNIGSIGGTVGHRSSDG